MKQWYWVIWALGSSGTWLLTGGMGGSWGQFFTLWVCWTLFMLMQTWGDSE